MLIIVFLIILYNISSINPSFRPTNILNSPSSTPLAALGRGIPIPQCPDPDNYRTVQGIIWSCVATIFACTWISMHPNIPDPRNSGWKNFRLRVMVFFYSLIGPEFITIWAFRQRLGAAGHMRAYNEKHNFLNPASKPSTKCEPAGGWFYDNWISLKDWFGTSKDRRLQRGRPWTLTHGFLFEMHGLVAVDKTGRPFNPTPPHITLIDRLGPNPSFSTWNLANHFSDVHIGVIFEINQLPENFDIAEEEINDRSKGDFFAKLFVVVQTTWFIVQCLGRWMSHLHVTELEVVTLAFAVLNIATYFFWWNKPLNMNLAIPVFIQTEILDEGLGLGKVEKGKDSRTSLLARIGRLIRPDLSPWKHFSPRFRFAVWAFNTLKSPVDPLVVMLGDIVFSNYVRIDETASAMFFSSEKGIEQTSIATAMIFIGVLFGCVHVIPFWTSSFPSVQEQYLWVACAGWITVEPGLILVAQRLQTPSALNWFWRHSSMTSAKFIVALSLFPVSLGFLLYAAARAILIYLAFSGLRTLPPDAFLDVSWSSFFPHI